jgi:hypothetical protein
MSEKKAEKKKGKPRGTGRRGMHFQAAFRRSEIKKRRHIQKRENILKKRRVLRRITANLWATSNGYTYPYPIN